MPPVRLLLCLLAAVLLGPAPRAQSADLDVDKHAETEEVRVGDEATFFIAVTNLGPDAATGVVVEDVLPAGLVYAAARPSRGHYDPASGAWTLGSLAAGGREVLTLTTTFTAAGPVENCAAVRASDQNDGNAANDTACTYVRPKREKLDPFAWTPALR